MKPGILSSTFHFPEIMLKIITRSTDSAFAVQRFRCSVGDSLATLRQAQDKSCPEYKVVTCRIRKAKKTHLHQAGEVVAKA